MPGRRGEPRPERWPARSHHAGHRGPKCAQRSGNRIGTTRLDAEFSRPSTCRSRRNTKAPLAAQPGAVPALCAIDWHGTCRAAGKHPPRLSPAGQGSDFRQNVPGDNSLPGPGATSECQSSRTAGPPAQANQVLQRHRDWADPSATPVQPSGLISGRPDAASTSLPPQMASSLHAHTRTNPCWNTPLRPRSPPRPPPDRSVRACTATGRPAEPAVTVSDSAATESESPATESKSVVSVSESVPPYPQGYVDSEAIRCPGSIRVSSLIGRAFGQDSALLLASL